MSSWISWDFINQTAFKSSNFVSWHHCHFSSVGKEWGTSSLLAKIIPLYSIYWTHKSLSCSWQSQLYWSLDYSKLRTKPLTAVLVFLLKFFFFDSFTEHYKINSSYLTFHCHFSLSTDATIVTWRNKLIKH